MFDTMVWSQLGPWGPVSVIVLLTLTGQLTPRWIVNRLLRGKDEQIAIYKGIADKRDEQHEKLYASAQVTVKLLEEIKAAGSGAGAGSGRT